MKEVFALNSFKENNKDIISAFMRSKLIAQDEVEFAETMSLLFLLKNYEDRSLDKLHYSSLMKIYEESVFPALPKNLKLLYINNYLFSFGVKSNNLEIDRYFSLSEIRDIMNTGSEKYNEKRLFSNNFILDNIHKEDFIKLFEKDGKINEKRVSIEIKDLEVRERKKKIVVKFFLRKLIRRLLREGSFGGISNWQLYLERLKGYGGILDKDMSKILTGEWKASNYERVLAGAILCSGPSFFTNKNFNNNIAQMFSLLDSRDMEEYTFSNIISDILSRNSHIGINFVKDEFIVVFLYRRHIKNKLFGQESTIVLKNCEKTLENIFRSKGMKKEEVAENVKKFMVLLWL